MIWQDFVLSGVGIVLLLSPIFILLNPAGRVLRKSSLTIAGALLVNAITILTLGVYLTAAISFINALLWLAVAIFRAC